MFILIPMTWTLIFKTIVRPALLVFILIWYKSLEYRFENNQEKEVAAGPFGKLGKTYAKKKSWSGEM